MSVAEPDERIRIAFGGEGSGEAELTWGQREIWEACALAGRSLAMGGVMALPPQTTVDEAVEVLRFSMNRHQGLRTRFRCDGTGRPVGQVLSAAGEITLDVFDVGATGDPGTVAAAVRDEYENRQFDYVNEWPVRMGVVRHGGVVTHAVVMYCHLIIDGYGLDALRRDLANLVRGSGAEQALVRGMPPLAQAGQQAEQAAARQTDNAMRHWERLLRRIPARRLAGSADPRTPRYWQIGLTSRAMQLALRPIVARTKVDSSAVLLAAFATSLAAITGINPSVIRTVVSNRFRPDFAESVSVVNQTGLCVIDAAGVAFDEVVVRSWQATLGAGMHSYYDPWRLKELIQRVGQERGEELDVGCFFNDLRRQRQVQPDSGPLPGAAQIRAATADTVLRWVYQRDQPNEAIFAGINDTPDTVDITLCGDTHVVSPADLRACVLGMEAVLVAAAHHGFARTGPGAAGYPASASRSR